MANKQCVLDVVTSSDHGSRLECSVHGVIRQWDSEEMKSRRLYLADVKNQKRLHLEEHPPR